MKMTKNEVINFLKKIKANYQSFSMEDYVINEWYDRLKPYDVDDVYSKLDQHLKGERCSEIPKIHYITKYLKNPSEKLQSIDDYIVYCPLCQKEVRYSQFNEHYDKCLSIRYLMKKIGNVTYEELEDLYIKDKATYDRVYLKYSGGIK
jgi:hypothetical protein